MNNWLGLIICFVYVFGIIGGAEGLRRWRGYSSGFTRKVIHIGVGMMSWALHFLFDNPWFFVVACAAFMVINLLDWRYGFFAAMASSDRSNLGTVYFPFAAAIVAIIFWETPPLMVAALMPLTWGDGMAPVIGKAYGRRLYVVHTSTRSVEGSMGFFVGCLLFTWLALWGMSGSPDISPAAALLPALVITLTTTLVEAVSIWGLDNLTITAVAILILQLWPF
ncbi:diacylglycerol/polyprenol kinase family protein [Candidatus Leptofilum sp.]|uniref:diacylglycerol/polyprenol kinase family protein n=1 Tax=Candidatus Leptofilum sp. TaxID=3241576 RepID=UPI003B5C584E